MQCSPAVGSVGLLLLLSLGCSTLRIAPVRSSPLSTSPTVPGAGTTDSAERFRDTLQLPEQAGTRAEDLYRRALLLFTSGDYERAAELFSHLGDTAPDSLGAEAIFYAGECAAAMGQLSHAQSSYERLLRRPAVAPSLRERALLRLGHVLCAQGQKSRAEEFFTQLRQEFPQSRYLPLATCSAIQPAAPAR